MNTLKSRTAVRFGRLSSTFFLVAQGKLEEAEVLFRRALEGYERVLGVDHPDTLNSVNNLGGLLMKQGKLEEAEVLFRRALEGCKRVLGSDHPYTLNAGRGLKNLPILRQLKAQSGKVKGHVKARLREKLAKKKAAELSGGMSLPTDDDRLQNEKEQAAQLAAEELLKDWDMEAEKAETKKKTKKKKKKKKK